MQTIITSAIFIVMLALVMASSNSLVKYAARLAKRFGVSEFLIGLTLVAIGTSLPELTNTVVASIKGANALALGNILGSNASNIALSIGLSILLARVVIEPRYYRREILVLLVSTLVFSVALMDGALSRAEGAILIAMFILYMNYLTKVFFDFTRLIDPKELAYFVEHLSNLSLTNTVRSLSNHYHHIRGAVDRKVARDVVGVAASCVVLIAASNVLVDKAIELAAILGVATSAVGATIVAIGTTTPELSVSIASVRKGYYHMLFGNIIGSNIINLLLIMGLGAVISPVVVSSQVVSYGLPMLGLMTLLFCWLLTRRQELHKNYGALLLVLYACFLFLMWIAR